jgi:hypothetical protein
MRPSENWCPNSASAYYLGSAESPTADFFQVQLKSSHSGDVASRSCSPQVPCPCPVIAFIQTSDQSEAGIAAPAGFPRRGGQVRGGGVGGKREGGRGTLIQVKEGGGGRAAMASVPLLLYFPLHIQITAVALLPRV